MTPDVTTLPISPQTFWIVAGLTGVVLLSALIFWALKSMERDHRPPLWEDLPQRGQGITVFLGLLWIGLFGLTIVAAYLGVWEAIHPKDASSQPNLGLGALLAALLGSPFLIWTTFIKQRTLGLSETALFNDKLNAAVEALYSRRQTTRAITANGEEKILTEWEDDIVQRSAAIDRLEGLAKERPTEAPRIASMLSVYVRELSRQFPAKDSPRSSWLNLIEPQEDSPPMKEDEALYRLNLHPDEVTIDGLKNWAEGLRPFRTDVEKAVQTLGRLRPILRKISPDWRIDLREANLQSFDLSKLDLSEAKFARVRMEGTNLRGARIDGADLFRARMDGAILRGSRMMQADLSETSMEGADLRGAQMVRANLYKARMEGADISEALTQGAHFTRARMEGTNLSQTRMERADLRWARMERADLSLAQMEGVDLEGAQMERAGFWKTSFDATTIWTNAQLNGAASRLVDFSTSTIAPNQLKMLFGDAGTRLPESIPKPAHWPTWELPLSGDHAFHDEWQKWWYNPEVYQPPPPPKSN